MDDTRETLRRGVGDFAPRPDGYERVVLRLARKRRRQRIVAAAVAIAIVLTGTALFARALTRDQEPLVPGPTPALPSDSLIAYSALVGSQTRGTPAALYVVSPGQAPRRIIGGDGRISQGCPAFSPDGTQLAYVEGPPASTDETLSSGALKVVGIDLEGTPTGDPTEVMVGLEQSSACPVWSPDGGRIAMVRGPNEIWIATLGQGATVIGRRSFHLEGSGSSPSVPGLAWSPDGSTLAAIFGRTAQVVPADGSGGPSVVYRLSGPGDVSSLAWSPDGSHLVIGGSTGNEGSCCANRGPLLEIVDVRTTSASSITIGGASKGWVIDWDALTWLPKQDRIAVIGFPPRGIALVDPRGGSIRLRPAYAPATDIRWSPDGRWFVYTAFKGGSYAVVAQPIDGSPPVVLTPWEGANEWAQDFTWRRVLG